MLSKPVRLSPMGYGHKWLMYQICKKFDHSYCHNKVKMVDFSSMKKKGTVLAAPIVSFIWNIMPHILSTNNPAGICTCIYICIYVTHAVTAKIISRTLWLVQHVDFLWNKASDRECDICGLEFTGTYGLICISTSFFIPILKYLWLIRLHV